MLSSSASKWQRSFQSGVRCWNNRAIEIRHANALRRIYEADRMLADDGQPPRSFHLVHLGGMRSEIDHPRWNPSWAVPDEHTIDDLKELGFLRVESSASKTRTFMLTMKGREEAAMVVEQQMSPRPVGGRAPSAYEVLQWLSAVDAEDPACFEKPSRLIDHALDDGLIEVAGREPLASRILGLIDEGYLHGDILDFDQATPEQLLRTAKNLHLSVKATETARSTASAQTTIYTQIVNSQIAGRDINTFVTFGDLLDRAHAEIVALEDVDDATKQAATGLIEVLRGKIAVASGQVLTAGGGALLGEVLARLLGVIHG